MRASKVRFKPKNIRQNRDENQKYRFETRKKPERSTNEALLLICFMSAEKPKKFTAENNKSKTIKFTIDQFFISGFDYFYQSQVFPFLIKKISNTVWFCLRNSQT